VDDKDLFEQLSRGPLTRNGFDESLRKRIHERLEQPKRRNAHFWQMNAVRVGAAFMVFAVVLLGVWMWNGWPNARSGESMHTAQPAASPSASSETAAPAEVTPQSAALIGIRKDTAGGISSSSYRTLLVVPEEDELVVAADGAGIWMPYKQRFWKIDAEPDAMGKGLQVLTASPAGESAKQPAADSSPVLRRTEKLLFAGNKYVSVLQTTLVTEEGKSVNENNVWVKDIEQLADTRLKEEGKRGQELHYKLSELVATDQAQASADRWTIARVAGKWVAKVPSKTIDVRYSASNAIDISDWATVDVTLPYDVLNHDSLALAWDDIYAIEPSAEDAYTSPTEDLLIVEVAGGIDIYAYKNDKIAPLPLDLEPGESIVMVQWATRSNVDKWKQMLGEWIPANIR